MWLVDPLKPTQLGSYNGALLVHACWCDSTVMEELSDNPLDAAKMRVAHSYGLCALLFSMYTHCCVVSVAQCTMCTLHTH